MDNTYRDALSRIKLTEDGKRRLSAALEGREAPPAPRPRRVLRVGLAAALTVCALMLAAGAVILSGPVLRDYFGLSAAPVYEQDSQYIGQSQTVDGWTLTITDCIGDDSLLYVGLELTAPEGTVLDQRFGFWDVTAKFDSQPVCFTSGCTRLPDADPTDNQMQFVFQKRTQESLNGLTMTLTATDLWRGKRDDAGGPIMDVAAKWRFDPIKLNFQTRTIQLEPDTPVPFLDGETTLTAVKVMPLGMSVSFEGGNLLALHTTGAERDGCYGVCFKAVTIALYGADGVWTLPGMRQDGGSVDPDGAHITINYSFEALLDLDALDHIEVCGVPIPIRQ